MATPGRLQFSYDTEIKETMFKETVLPLPHRDKYIRLLLSIKINITNDLIYGDKIPD
jgi:hypothetical protein